MQKLVTSTQDFVRKSLLESLCMVALGMSLKIFIPGSAWFEITLAMVSIHLYFSIRSRRRHSSTLNLVETKFKTLVDSVEDYALYLLDRQGNVLTWNSGAEKIKGYAESEVVGKNYALFFPVEAQQTGEPGRILQEALKQGVAHRTDWRIRKDGSRFWAGITVRPIYDMDHHWIGFSKVTHNLTDEKRRNDELKRWKHVFDHSEFGIAIADPEKNLLVAVNSAYANMHGYTIDEMIGFPVEKLFVESERKKWLIHLDAVHQGKHQVFEALRQRKDGTTFPSTVDVSAVKDDNGELIYRAAYVRDLTDLKAMKERIHENQDQQRFLADLSDTLSQSLDYTSRLEVLASMVAQQLADWVTIDLADDHGDLRRLNLYHRNLLKWPLINKNLRSYPPSPNSTYGVRECIRTKKPIIKTDIVVEDLMNADLTHDYYYALMSGLGLKSIMHIPLVAHDRAIGAVTLVASDRNFSDSEFTFAQSVVERAALAIDNARLYHESQKAIQVREDTVAIVSHDLKNPLASIKLSSEIVNMALESVRDPQKSADLPAVLSRISKMNTLIARSAERAVKLIIDLLDFAKMQSGTFEIQMSSNSVKDLLSEAVESFQGFAAERKIELSVRSCEPDFRVECDPARIAQVFSNLIGNAMKYTFPGGKIEVNCNQIDDGSAVFEVRDSGQGIPASAIPHLFDRYWQLQESRVAGTGLGLSIVKGIVNAHHGKVWVESKCGEGSSFYFSLRAEVSEVTPALTINRNLMQNSKLSPRSASQS